MNELPEGPDEEPVSKDSIAAVTAVLETLAHEIDLTEFKRSRRKADVPTDSEPEVSGDADAEQPVDTVAS